MKWVLSGPAKLLICRDRFTTTEASEMTVLLSRNFSGWLTSDRRKDSGRCISGYAEKDCYGTTNAFTGCIRCWSWIWNARVTNDCQQGFASHWTSLAISMIPGRWTSWATRWCREGNSEYSTWWMTLIARLLLSRSIRHYQQNASYGYLSRSFHGAANPRESALTMAQSLYQPS